MQQFDPAPHHSQAAILLLKIILCRHGTLAMLSVFESRNQAAFAPQ